MKQNREEMTNTLVRLLGEMRESQNERQESIGKRIGELTDSNEKALGSMRDKVEERLKEIQDSNDKKLEEMRKTVDEKLQSTLEKRIGESFKRVSEHLEAVHKGLGEMKNLANGVGDLKKVLTNVKTRGTWGEVQLGNILEQIMTQDQYGTNVATRPGSSERVEYAVKLPGPEDDPDVCVWLPIDAKFPQEDYLRLVEASEAGDVDAVNQATAALRGAVLSSAKDIRDKYIDPPNTTDFAIMFLPTEGLYAEVLRQTGMVEQLQREMRIVAAGPTTLAAILSSLRMGFRTLAIEKRSSEVWQVLRAVKTEFGKFGDVLTRLGKQLDTAKRTVEQTGVRTRAMEKKLRGVETLPGSDATRLLELPEEEAEDQE
ncbi:MAG: DNA recombination protein RmuC [Candidatus Krumholzibacteria bacterium]|nr:DNA recombination protein RmuC [Candidatus Krumholzibacteria bacterium]